MSSRLIGEAIDNGTKTAVLAVGAMEQHGPHMAISVDATIGEEVAIRVAQILGNAILCPTVQFGVSDSHMAFPGTITLSPATLRAILVDYGRSLARHGFEEIVMIPGHKGNYEVAEEAVELLQSEHPNALFVASPTDFPAFWAEMNETTKNLSLDQQRAGGHAGEHETSMMLRVAPEKVFPEKMEVGFIGDMASMQEAIQREGIQAMSANGLAGDPFLATQEHGEAYLDTFSRFIVRAVHKARGTEEG